ncbi:Flp pilus assembly complex ATPase component TadA [Pseudoclavibacter alba]|uniref:Flp pilus assembly complex ATPase component TadA n=1 Tax=Pseudoclavibacter albus TaxID=272241 RepID=A0ABT2HVC5_9MICO|nr:ATPase, T2SS/T4P/T4SS family [Pseudoclavibacter alba]MCT2042269.1 Flp pilus assembly complex ATPase component TadA [Pseudoclavibacter alba]
MRDERERARAIVHEEVRRVAEQGLASRHGHGFDEQAMVREVLARVTGFGALQPYLDDPEIEEIWVNAPSRVFVGRGGVAELTPTVIPEHELRDLIERMLQSSGRRIDLSSPFVDASLPDGSRLHVAIPDVVRKYPAINIRKFTRRLRDLSHLVERDSLTHDAAQFLRAMVRSGASVLVSGATHTGKTTMVNALLASVSPHERIITVEETFELDLAARDVVAMQCRQASLEGSGEITLRRLVKEALRMRPDRLVVGEAREAEALDLLIAMNSGLPSMCTIHANSARDALQKLATLPLLAGRNIDADFIVPTIAQSLDLVVHLERAKDGHRQVHSILAPSGAVHARTIEAATIFERRGAALVATGSYPPKPRFEPLRAELRTALDGRIA